MKTIAACRIGSVIAWFAVIAVAGAARAQSPGGPGGAAGIRPPVSWTTPDGSLQLTPPAGWEDNPRLATDNGVIGFVHPSGMQMDQAIPAWLLVDRRARNGKVPFPSVVRACLNEGVSFDYIPADSAKIATADGRTLYTYRFNQGKDGSERGLALLEAPTGTILFRYETVSLDIWNRQQGAFDAMLKSIRFLPSAK